VNKDKRNDEWAKAKRLCRLSNEEVRMARELGMGPRSLVKNIPNPKQRWKAPVGVWVRNLYAKKTGKRDPAPAQVRVPRPAAEPDHNAANANDQDENATRLPDQDEPWDTPF
jgi:hypothetical protein